MTTSHSFASGHAGIVSIGAGPALGQTLEALRADRELKVLLLHGLEQAFPDGGRGEFERFVASGLHEALAGFPCPVIATLADGAGTTALLAAALCDFMVLSAEGGYRYAGAGPAERAYLAARLGEHGARALLDAPQAVRGAYLRQQGWGCPIVAPADLASHAMALAGGLATKSASSLALLKRHLGRKLAPLAAALGGSGAASPLAAPAAPFDIAVPGETPAGPIDAPGRPVPLASPVISATAHADGVIVVTMADREARNMFSDAFIAGMAEVFAHIEASPDYKVVVLTGYDSYFAAGGTRQALEAIQDGRASFTDDRTFRLALDCPLPVIAAMQGHAIGGGLSLGLFADVVLLAAGSKYVCPYMHYGFTPGAGATLVVPHKLGQDLGREALMSAREYDGAELKARGLAHAVLARAEVLPAALRIAHEAARYSRAGLLAWKGQASQALRMDLDDIVPLELAMHGQTFVGRTDTLNKIREVFDPMHPAAATAPSAPAITARLKTLLAEELQMREQDLDEHAQFVELGLDSITGVTWMRKINGLYGTGIAAIEVYSHPTLAQLAAHVQKMLGGQVAADGGGAAPASAPATAPAPVPASGARGAALVDALRRTLARELQMDAGDIDADAQFVDLGLDSITGVTWVRKINAEHGTAIAAVQLYSHPTLNRLAAYVAEHGAAAAAATVPAAPAPAAPARRKLLSWRTDAPARLAAPAVTPGGGAEPVAVIGMAGQFPMARTLDQFWDNLAAGRDCISEVAPERWSVDRYYQAGAAAPGKTNSRWLGALEDYDRFDPLFFNISPGEAECMDPQQRLFLEACWQAIEHAGHNPRALAGSRCGVFAGCGSGDYQLQTRELRQGAQGFTGGAPSILAARISYFLNLQGPSIAIDTACSSSLVALSTACDSLNAGNCDLALAGGVYVMVGPDMQIKTSQAGMLSQDGRCYTFDQRANGFVPGEAVGVVLLKRLADARRDGDPVLGVIQGWGINQDGKTNGITAPNPDAQTRLQQEVYERFGIDPAGISLIEAHGTGTKLGDPIEVAALKQSFAKYTAARRFCALGSVKSNIGHCLQAAGISGFIKLMLALRHRQLPPSIHFTQLNEHIDLDDSPFYVNTSLRPWTPNGTGQRLAAISSFGFSGTNAHLVVAEAPPRAPAAVVPGPALVPLSARSPAQLAQAARNLLGFIEAASGQPALADIAYTLQTGRDAMDERLCIVAASMAQLAQALRDFCAGLGSAATANVKRHRESLSLIGQDPELREAIVGKCLAKGELAKLADWWVKGLAVDWSALYGQARPARIALPVYPFARERYWIDAPGADPVPPSGSQLHPLLHENTSDLYQASFSATFSGREFFLADHRVRSGGSAAPMLPGVAYLEMARAALVRALPGVAPGAVIELHDVVWLQPVIASTGAALTIELLGDGEQLEFFIRSRDGEADVVHCEGRAQVSGSQAPERIDLAALRARCTGAAMDGQALYPRLARMGLEYGPAHQGIASLRAGAGEVLAELQMPAGQRHGAGQFVLHPSMADSALQATAGLIFDLERLPGRPALPFAVESVRVLAPCTEAMAAWVRYAPDGRGGDGVVKFDLELCGQDGAVCVQMRGFSARVLDAAFDEGFYRGVIDALLNGEVSVDDAARMG